MKKTLITIVALTTLYLYGQPNFFVRPIMNFKADVSSSESLEFSDYVMDVSPYYKYDNIAFHSFFHGLDIGLSTGFKTQSKKYSFELGICGDETQSGFRLNYFIKQPNMNSPEDIYAGSNTETIFGRAFLRYFFQNTIQLKEFGNKSNINLLFGVGFSRKKNELLNIPVITSTNSVQVADNIYLDRKSSLYVLTFNNYFFHFGLSSSIYKKKKYLFDVALFYNHGLREMSVVTSKLIEKDLMNSTASNRLYSSVSKGSGLYFQISRQINFNFFQKNKN